MRFKALISVLLVLGLALSSGLVVAADPITISGHVAMADGTDPSSVVITVTSMTGGATLTANPSASGDYIFDSLGSGPFNVSASKSLYSSNGTYSYVGVTNTHLDFTLTPLPGTVTGFVSDGVVSVTGALVGLMGEAGNFSSYSIGPIGEYSIQNVTPGDYTPYADKDGYKVSILPPIKVTSGSTFKLNFTLSTEGPETSNLNGTVTYNGETLAGVTVTLTLGEETERSTQTNTLGFYSFSGIPAGNYTLRFTMDGYIGVSKQVTVQPLKDRIDDVTMKKDSLPGTSGFLFGYDLSHSLMIVGLGLALTTLLIALFIKYRIGNKPELLSKEEDEQKED